MIKAIQRSLPCGLGFCLSFLEFSFVLKHTSMSLSNSSKIPRLGAPRASRFEPWPITVSEGCLCLSLHSCSQPGLGETEWAKAEPCQLSSSSGLWTVRLIQGQIWLPRSLPIGNQPPGVSSNEQAAFSSYILVSPPFENKTLPHLLASGIAIIARRIIGGNSIWQKPCWFEAQSQ
jgi:hypothetical protein